MNGQNPSSTNTYCPTRASSSFFVTRRLPEEQDQNVVGFRRQPNDLPSMCEAPLGAPHDANPLK